LAQVCKR
jgi:DNA replication protein DnaC